MVKQKKQNNNAFLTKSDVLHYHCTRMKRLLQYSCLCAKNNYALFRALSLTSHPLISYLISFYSARTSYVLLATPARSSSLIPRFSFLLLGMHVYYTFMLCISLPLRTRFPTVLVYFSSRASCHCALTSYHTLHYCSVPVQRTSRQSWLCRCLATSAQHPLPAMLAMHHALQALVQEYESESPTNSGVIEDTGNSTCAVYCVRYEEGRGGIQKCCVCWKGQKT